MAGPVRPEDGSFGDPFDPLRLGLQTFRLRWPKTARLLATEFKLSKKQSWSVAWRVRRHASLRRGRAIVLIAALATGLVTSPVLAVFAVLPLWEAFLSSTARGTGEAMVPIWAIGIGVVIAVVSVVAWVLYECIAIDRLMDRSIRDRWRDQICLWCAHDMDETPARGDRWAVCSECGMRSPGAVRSP